MIEYPIPASQLRQEYEQQKALFENQPTNVQHFLEDQARQIADGLVSKAFQVHFTLPNLIVTQVRQVGQPAAVNIPKAQRQQVAGSFLDPLSRRKLREALLRRLQELEQSPDQAIALSASLLRFVAATYMVSTLLPAGRSVIYRSYEDEAIPSIPTGDDAPESAIAQASDAIVEQGQAEAGRGELQTPFVPAARKFYLPQWVAFDDGGNLLVGSEKEAEAHVQSMQKYALILHRASSLAPYIVACDEYQRKRYGILGQLINQGRALAYFKTQAIIHEIQARAKNGSLNQGLSISLPYFDDQNLVMTETRFDVIPTGRIMFIRAFVVRASRNEQAKVSQDTRLNYSTRKHLHAQLRTLETAFIS